jgi:hypothetical protein
MGLPAPLSNLAAVLRASKNQSRPYNLLLTSAISLTADVLNEICGSTEWALFRQHLRGFGKGRLTILHEHLGPNHQQGYRSLARLIQAGYFSTILTTNLDSTLEDALLECDVHPPQYQILIIKRDEDQYIAEALESQPNAIRIIKLRGSLRENALPETYPDFFELRDPLRAGLARYLNQNILIVGDIAREDDITRSLTIRGQNNIYYVLPHNYSIDDDVVKAIIARGYDPASFVISGPYGEFNTFFTTLETQLRSASSAPSTSPPSSPAPSVIEDAPSAASNTPATQKPVVAPPEPPPPAQSQVTPPGSQRESQQHALSPSQTQKEPETASPQEQDKENLPTRSMLIKVISGIIAVIALLAAISFFARQTPSVSAIFILPLLIIVFVFILGLMGILKADQITSLFAKGLDVKGAEAKPTDEKKGNS